MMMMNSDNARPKRATAASHPGRDAERRLEAAAAPAARPVKKRTLASDPELCAATGRAADKKAKTPAPDPPPAPSAGADPWKMACDAKDQNIALLTEAFEREKGTTEELRQVLTREQQKNEEIQAEIAAKDAEIAAKDAEIAAKDAALQEHLLAMEGLQSQYDQTYANLQAEKALVAQGIADLALERSNHDATRATLDDARASLAKEQSAVIAAAADAFESEQQPSGRGRGRGRGDGPTKTRVTVPPIELPHHIVDAFSGKFFDENRILNKNQFKAAVCAFNVAHYKYGPDAFEQLTPLQKIARRADGNRQADMIMRLLSLEGCSWSQNATRATPDLRLFLNDFVNAKEYGQGRNDRVGGGKRKLWICKRLWPTIFASINSASDGAEQQDGAWGNAGKWASAAITLGKMVQEWLVNGQKVLSSDDAKERDEKWEKSNPKQAKGGEAKSGEGEGGDGEGGDGEGEGEARARTTTSAPS